MQRNVDLYPRYFVLTSIMAWIPIFFLFFSEHVTLAQVLQLEALYYVTVVLLEVPSGYFSDSVGRRPTLLISATAFALAYVCFIIVGVFGGPAFLLLAIGEMLLAVGFAFKSGTDTSFYYDSLAAVGRADDYGDCEARVERNSLLVSSVAILAGGLAGMIALHWAYVISLIGACGALATVLRFTEPTVDESDGRRGVVAQVRLTGRYLQQPALRWIFVFAVLMTILNHIPYEFYQPYLDLLRGELALADGSTPLAAALIMGLSTFIGSLAAGRSMKIVRQIGTANTLLLATAVQTLLILVMGATLHPLVVPFILLRTIPFGLMRAPMNAAIAPQVAQRQRATYLSIQSLAGRLAFSLTLFLLSLIAGDAVDATWPALATMLRVAAVIGLFGFVALFLTRRATWPAESGR